MAKNIVNISHMKTATCRFCGLSGTLDELEINKYGDGFWCADCDGFTYFEQEDNEKQKFILILEDKGSESKSNLPKIRLNKRISPLRYPGGKSRLIDFLYAKLKSDYLDTFVEPYAGGASVGLALLDAGVVNKLVLNDIDYGIFSLFSLIKRNPYHLINMIKNNIPTHEDYFAARQIIADNYKNNNMLQSAWSLLLVNRLAYSGIVKANPLGGRYGSQDKLLVRWNPSNLCSRILAIHKLSDKIEVYNTDACKVIEELYWHPSTTIFIDPPYFEKGKKLYTHFYEEDDHDKLAWLLDALYQGCPGANILVTYDNSEYIKDLYWNPEVCNINRRFSI